MHRSRWSLQLRVRCALGGHMKPPKCRAPSTGVLGLRDLVDQTRILQVHGVMPDQRHLFNAALSPRKDSGFRVDVHPPPHLAIATVSEGATGKDNAKRTHLILHTTVSWIALFLQAFITLFGRVRAQNMHSRCDCETCKDKEPTSRNTCRFSSTPVSTDASYEECMHLLYR